MFNALDLTTVTMYLFIPTKTFRSQESTLGYSPFLMLLALWFVSLKSLKSTTLFNFIFCEPEYLQDIIEIPLLPFMRLQTYKCNFFETLNLNIVLRFTMKLSKTRSSFQHLDMFQSVSTYDTTYNISHLCLYISVKCHELLKPVTLL